MNDNIRYYCTLHHKASIKPLKEKCIKNVIVKDRKRKKYCKHLIIIKFEDQDNDEI